MLSTVTCHNRVCGGLAWKLQVGWIGQLPVGIWRDLDASLSSKSRKLSKPLPVHMKALKYRLRKKFSFLLKN
jgi:hypothetical protein